MRIAAIWRRVTAKNVAVVAVTDALFLSRAAVIMPTIAATPTTRVMAISVGEYVPVIMRAQPSRKSQISDIMKNQIRKHDRAAHFASAEPRMASTTAIHSGVVWTIWRNTPCETAPTMRRAAIIAKQQPINIRESRCMEVSLNCTTLLAPSRRRTRAALRRLAEESARRDRLAPPVPVLSGKSECPRRLRPLLNRLVSALPECGCV